jgi:hypothetical protein
MRRDVPDAQLAPELDDLVALRRFESGGFGVEQGVVQAFGSKFT